MQISSLKPALPKPTVRIAFPARLLRRKTLLKWLFAIVLVAFLYEAGRVAFGSNFHEVLPGRIYRSAQLKPKELRSKIEKHGIRTVINLRGCCTSFDWYLDECTVTHDMNVSMEDITMSATRLPARSELVRLIEVLDRCEYPILLHCRQGADRTSLASVVALLLVSDADLATARMQCTPRFAHLPILATKEMDRFLDMYEFWLHSNGKKHSPEVLRHWALHFYTPDPAPARLELLDPISVVRVGEPVTLRLRATNLSNSDWYFKQGTCAGVHARYVVINSTGQVLGLFRAGRFEATVPSGGHIDLDLPLPPFRVAGSYRLNIDLADKNLNFGQLGSEWLDLEIVAKE